MLYSRSRRALIAASARREELVAQTGAPVRDAPLPTGQGRATGPVPVAGDRSASRAPLPDDPARSAGVERRAGRRRLAAVDVVSAHLRPTPARNDRPSGAPIGRIPVAAVA